jgi:hypothetical protein
MRSVDLAIYADLLASRAADTAARLERTRARIRQAAIEDEARSALPPETVGRLERLGALAATDVAAARQEAGELAADLHALEQLQTWVEHTLFMAREEGYVMRD